MSVVEQSEVSGSTRRLQLGLTLIAMMSISSPQYVWTLFTKSFQDTFHTGLPAVQVVRWPASHCGGRARPGLFQIRLV